ncbi:MAG: THUMP domain-containing protein [Candidatus Bathyarchaeota archaeon]|nr:THUMP domain-containing protein [Candidatus Bathyarchaeota archaeon]
MARLFFLLSGEDPTLPFSELASILEAEGYEFKILQKLAHVLRLESSPESASTIESRASMTRICALELFLCQANVDAIVENLERAELNDLVTEGETFVVRVKRVRGSAPKMGRLKLERKIGGIISSKVKGLKVDLEKPGKIFVGVLTEDSFIFGLGLAEVRAKSFFERRPRRKIFFHPTAMRPKLARCMVNLAQPKREELVLDPFCGTGSLLVEASLVGCRVLGFDADRRMAVGSIQNLSHYGLVPEGIGVADARHLPLADSSVNCVVTDPPYGRSSTTFRLGVADLIESFLADIIDKIVREGRICLAAPTKIRISELSEKIGLQHIESHLVYVHRELTREIAVLKRG